MILKVYKSEIDIAVKIILTGIERIFPPYGSEVEKKNKLKRRLTK